MKYIQSKIIPIPRKDIDTDLIISADHLTTTEKTGLSQFLFQGLRLMYADFPLNLKKYDEAQIIVARENFGCGSSREHAVWAIADWGITAIIATSFSNIFYNNALKNGILPVIVSEKVVEKIFRDEKKEGHYEVKIDIEKQEIFLADGEKYSFEMESYRKKCFMEGTDDMDYLLENKDLIENFKDQQKLFFDISKI